MKMIETWMDKQIEGIFMWTIDKYEERRKIDEIVRSEYFYVKMLAQATLLALA